MDNNNDFLKSYKNKMDNNNVQEEKQVKEKQVEKKQADKQPSKPTRNDYDTRMTYEEKSTFQEPRRHLPSAPHPTYNGGNSNIRKMIVASLSTLLIAIILIIIITSSLNKVSVLDFTNWTKNDFSLWASENKILSQIEEQYNDTYEEGRIFWQEVTPNTNIKKNDFLKVIVSKGPDLTVELDLPDIMYMTKAEIEQWSEENLMTKVRISTAYNATVALGKVIEYQVNDDTVVDKVKRDTPIYVVISKGEESASSVDIKIPDFKSLGVTDTVVFAQDNGLILTIDERHDDYVPANSVISQSLAVDSVVHPGDALHIVVSLGEIVIMPSFKNMTQSDAVSRANSLGISVTVKERYSSSSEGRLIAQSVEEGTVITNDTKLELRYSLGSKIAVGNYVGQQKFIMDEWLEKENKIGARITVNVTYTQNEQDSGIILQQTIKDTYITRDKTIKIVVSSGDNVFVPDFVAPSGAGYDTAITREKAEAMANRVQIILIFVESSNSSRLPGEVWSQSTAAGKEIKKGSTVTLKYNPVNKTVLMPDFSGKTEAEVKAMSQYSQLTITFVVGDEVQATPSVVYEQSEAVNTTVAYGTEVVLTLSPE